MARNVGFSASFIVFNFELNWNLVITKILTRPFCFVTRNVPEIFFYVTIREMILAMACSIYHISVWPPWNTKSDLYFLLCIMHSGPIVPRLNI